MSVTIPTKDRGDVCDKFGEELECPRGLEDGNENYIKLNLGLRE